MLEDRNHFAPRTGKIERTKQKNRHFEVSSGSRRFPPGGSIVLNYENRLLSFKVGLNGTSVFFFIRLFGSATFTATLKLVSRVGLA